MVALYASAVVVLPGVAVTNAHVVRATDRLGGWVSGRGLVDVTVLAVSDRMDIAVLGVSVDLGTSQRLGQAKAGTPVWAMGTTASLLQSPVAAGRVVYPNAWSCADFTATDPASCRRVGGLMYAAPIAPGYSGGPVVDQNGDLVGITQGIYTDIRAPDGVPPPNDTTMAFAFPIEDVMAEVNRLVGPQLATAQQPGGAPPL